MEEMTKEETMMRTEVRNVQAEISLVRGRISSYEEEVRRHPLARLIRSGALPATTEQAFARYLFTDSWMWPPMLIAMRDRARHPRLVRAIADNLEDEAGGRGASHVLLCARFLKSIGIVPSLQELPDINRTVAISMELSEPQTVGWLAAAEILTLPLYELALGCFGSKPGVDTKYLDVHMEVDEDHIAWLWGALEALMEEGASIAEVLEGVALGARATLNALDEIYEDTIGEVLVRGD